MRTDVPNILLVNPWIHDFAAYDFWAKPVGLLYLASILRLFGFSVSYIDCLDRFHPKMPRTDPYARYGRGPYLKTKIKKPIALLKIPRNFSRYGIKKEWFVEDLLCLPRPDLILVTSIMTYWYPGVQETIRVIKEIYPKAPVMLGGIYASLCKTHAVNQSGADKVITGAGEKYIIKIAKKFTNFLPNTDTDSILFDPEDLNAYPYPAFDLQNKITYIPLLTSRGCPFSCSYCASSYLTPKFVRRSPEDVIEEITFWHKKFGVIDFVFYDDALLVDAKNHAIPIMEGIIKTGFKLRFHTPNAVHIREISKKTAFLMFKAGFETLRLGLETGVFENRSNIDKKVKKDEFFYAVKCLKDAGFQKDQIGAYLLAGLPGQEIESISDSIKMVSQLGIMPIIAYYTPIPHTALWKKAQKNSPYDLESDPLYTNNAILPCMGNGFSWKTVSYLRASLKAV